MASWISVKLFRLNSIVLCLDERFKIQRKYAQQEHHTFKGT